MRIKSDLFVIIQARMTSTRLPGKVMLPLCGKTVLEVMIERLNRFAKNIIIATTDDGSEKPIIELCEKKRLRFFRGDTNNVLDRYYKATTAFGAKNSDTIVRLTSDCPLIDQEILKKMLEEFGKKKCDYLSNTIERSFPRGLDIEIFSFEALKRVYENAKMEFEKEHVTTHIHTTHKDEFMICQYKDKEDNSKYRLTLDEEADYEAIKEIYKLLKCKTDFSYEDLIEILEKNPYIYEINSHVEQKKV
ncbi:cytidylyltransferase domain-containing protein [Nitrosophilus labii]|uniref:cytidylyltransferase domain-containing protein n=1 Tax=Nitrosophilus labii TaxID=2706014 RepID=UPI0016569A99|nr:glycosyltransferase family protein [Nitrosophilus labii]